MSNLANDIRALFPNAVVGPPCSEPELAEAEELLNCHLPPSLRELYLGFNGMAMMGRVLSIYPLLPAHSEVASMVHITKFVWQEPWATAGSSYLFFGMSSSQEFFGMSLKFPHLVIRYDYDMEQPESAGATLVEALEGDEATYQRAR